MSADDPVPYRVLHPLLLAFERLQREHGAMKLVLHAAAATHQNRAALLAQLDHLAELREVSDLNEPLEDEDREARTAELAHWRQWIERAP